MTQDSPHPALSLEPYVSVDVETAGPNPSQYSLLAIGACLVSRPDVTFYVELQPQTADAVPSALVVHGLSLERLSREGLDPREALQRLADWLAATLPQVQPVFVGFNAPFDWMFVNDYFHRFLGHNPFGHSALDIKAFYMGLRAVPWSETTMNHVAEHYRMEDHHVAHHALHDALDQADVFRRMVAEATGRSARAA